MASDLWYYVKNGQSQDPVPWNVLVQMARAGGIGPNDQIWNESLPRWVPASAVEGLLGPGRPASPAEPDAPAGERSHSWIGILSLSMGLFFCFAEMALVLIAGVMESQPGGIDEESAEAVVLGLLLLAGGAGAFFGALIGLVGLFMRNSNKVLAAFGVALNAMCVTGLILLFILGLVAGG